MSQQVVEDLALFFDFENIAISLRKQNGQNPDFKKIIAWFSQYGRIAVARAYGDWAVHHKFMFPLRENKFEPVFVPTITNHYNGSTIIKNAVDMKIAVEATAVLYTRPHITTYGLLTGDKDYLPLIEHMRNLGKKVIAVAVEENTASSLREAVDLFVPYREVVAEFSEQPPAPVFKLLLQAIHQLVAASKIPLLERIKPQMRKILPEFDEKLCTKADGKPYERFLDFVEDAQQLGLVVISRQGSAITVNPAGAAGLPAKQPGFAILPPQRPASGMALN